MLSQRVVLHQKLQDQIEKSLVRKSEAKGERLNKSALEKQVSAILGGQNTTDMVSYTLSELYVINVVVCRAHRFLDGERNLTVW